jgi:hypothetical protein
MLHTRIRGGIRRRVGKGSEAINPTMPKIASNSVIRVKIAIKISPQPVPYSFWSAPS